MPIFANEMVSSLPGNTKHIIYKLGDTIFSSVYNTVKGSFTNGYFVEHMECNWVGISNHLTDVPNDLSAVISECTGIKIPIKSIVTYGNNTSLILEEGKHLLQNATLVELSECTTNACEAILQEHNAKMLVNHLRDIFNNEEITLNNAQEAGVDIFNLLNIPITFTTDNLKVILDYFNVTLDARSTTALGNNILDLLSKPFTEAITATTEKPNDETNGGGYTGAYITATVFGIISLGFAAKYGWDWYTLGDIKDKNLELEGENIRLEGENIKLQKDNINLSTLIEFQAILDEMIDIGNLTDILAILSNTQQDTINLHGQDYDMFLLKSKIQGLDKAITKLNSVSNICVNINSLGNTLHKICDLLNGKDNFIAIKSFTNLIKESRKMDIQSEEHKNCLEKIFETILEIDETSSGVYTYIPELPDHEMSLLADVSSAL
ncbi:hypothetical protein A1C_05625 [Rickettsia akari str. Hartford]|uniref:Uncharacterized protein n=1 Tax=Rickettsia akari (strain Hartford) TaxID=293614 RepID=A8GPN5_RICAH|nr:DUF5460 family protein [Rickettsia akari]ABV75360.1 hypothetical protein A1C_05625 [Rickettsia akari str. Hartford]